MRPRLELALFLLLLGLVSCAPSREEGITVTFPASVVGREGEVLRAQLRRFMAEHPGIRVVVQETPDAADERRQLYVQWLNAHAPDPDVLQLDVIWTAEFAAAGWIAPLDSLGPIPPEELEDFFEPCVRANRWRGRLYALPWFVDVGMLYFRTDLVESAPRSFSELVRQAREGRREGVRYGIVWQGARYEGLVTVFLEHLAAFGGEILDREGGVRVDSPEALAALRAMTDAVRSGVVPREALTWHEEETRLVFQRGEAVFLRNWPYALPLLSDGKRSAVAGRFSVTPFPPAEGGRPAAALGGAQLAVNARSDVPEAAFAVVRYLTAPERMLERARATGQFPARRSLYRDPRLARALGIPPKTALRVVEHAVPRPVTPVYNELSEILQIHLHRALLGSEEPEVALARAAGKIRALLRRAALLRN